jgi:hypothetical protein
MTRLAGRRRRRTRAIRLRNSCWSDPRPLLNETALVCFSKPQVGQAGIIPCAMSNSNKKSEPILAFKSAQDLEAYFASEPRASRGFWLKLSKASAVEATINKVEAVEAALCWGWIDGRLDKFDDQYFLVRMTPRRSGSRWSAKNRAAAERLLMQGRLQPPVLPRLRRRNGMGDGRPHMPLRDKQRFRRTWRLRLRRAKPPSVSSRRWIAPIATRSSTG